MTFNYSMARSRSASAVIRIKFTIWKSWKSSFMNFFTLQGTKQENREQAPNDFVFVFTVMKLNDICV